jgi:hypothetical protein
VKAVHQDKFRDPDGPDQADRGNCFQAAIASMLELDLDDVPNFVQDDEDGKGNWWTRTQEWLGARGLWLADLPSHNWKYVAPPDALTFVTGPSPRDPTGKMKHIVLWRGRGVDGSLVHDPHPDGTGLSGDDDSWGHYVLVPLDPAKDNS